jgi:thymidylate synthase
LKKLTFADIDYAMILEEVLNGETLTTRNSEVIRAICPPMSSFGDFPLVTLRKTAVKMALREWEWFMSGNDKCPDELLPWWSNQLNPDGRYIDGYATQLRGNHDQVQPLIDGLISSPMSRRHVISMWDSLDMRQITNNNENPRTPTTCHGTIIQVFVSPSVEKKQPLINLYTYQRSADVILGLPHNFVQYYAFMLFLCKATGYQMGMLHYQLGDAHIYNAEGHMEVAHELLETMRKRTGSLIVRPELEYSGDGKTFLASDFRVVGDVPKPTCTIKPKLVD